MVFSFEICRHYLYDVHEYVYNDHKILLYVFTHKELNLRQRRLLELLKDYDMSVLSHPKKANVVAYTLSHMTIGSVSHVEEAKKDQVRYVYRLARSGLKFEDSPNVGFMVHNNSKSSLVLRLSLRNILIHY